MGKTTGHLGFVRLIVICASVMLALPFGLRLLSDHFLPRNREASRSATEKFQDLFGDGRTSLPTVETFIGKPIAEWTDQQKAAEPELHGWLAVHTRQILPWEWSEAAKVKDAKGYRRSWHDLYDELDSLCKLGLKPLMKSRDVWMTELQARTNHVGRLTNQLDRLQATLSSGSFPIEVALESLERGWLWGYNCKVTKRKVETADALREVIDAESEKFRIQAELVVRLHQNLQTAETRMREIGGLQMRLRECDKGGSNDVSVVISVVRRCFRPAR